MTVAHTKRSRGKRRELEPLDTDVKLGPKMLAIPEKQREFIIALFTRVRPGHGAASKAARLVGFGTATSSPQSIASISSRLMNNEVVLDAMREFGERFIRSTAPAAIRAMHKLILTPSHKDHARAVSMVLERVHGVETTHHVKVDHDASPSLVATAAVLARIHALALSAGIDPARMPPLIDAKPVRKLETP